MFVTRRRVITVLVLTLVGVGAVLVYRTVTGILRHPPGVSTSGGNEWWTGGSRPEDDEAPEDLPRDPHAPRRLTDIATRHPRFDAHFYGWLTPTTLLLARSDETYPRHKLFRHDLSKGEETPLLTLTKLYNQADGGSFPQISPDGKWVLWWDGKVHNVTIYGARLDGTGHFQIPKAKAEWDNMYLFWLADSRRFVELVMPRGHKFTHASIRGVDKPEVAETVPIPESSPLQAACCMAGADIAVAAGDRLIAFHWGLDGIGGVGPKTTIGEVGLGPKASPDRTSTVAPPPGSTFRCGGAISPHSDRIAWLVGKPKKGGGNVVSIWVSRLDGSGWREMGSQEVIDPEGKGGGFPTKHMVAPYRLRWLPDGKTLSFLYGDLYTIPVPGATRAGGGD
jgi:hypothetical protein